MLWTRQPANSKEPVAHKLAGAALGAVGAGGALVAMGALPAKEILELVERAGIPFTIMLLLIWLARPVAVKHNEFLERTAKSQENLAESYEKLVEVTEKHGERLDVHTGLLRELCQETKKQTKKLGAADVVLGDPV